MKKVCTVGYWLNYELHQKYGVMNEHQLMELTYIINLMVNALHSLQVISFRMLQNNVRFRNEECMVVGDDTHLQIVVWDDYNLITRFQSSRM